jgi:hypothetical protein
MKRIRMLLVVSALLTIGGCGASVVDNATNADGKPRDIVAPAVETPSPAAETPSRADEQPAINAPIKAPEEAPKAVEVAPAVQIAPAAVVQEEGDASGESGGSVLDVLGKALRRGIINAPDDREKEQ